MADYTPQSWSEGSTGTAAQFTALSAALKEEETLNDYQDARLDLLASYITNFPRYLIVNNGYNMTSGTVFFVYFTADRSMTVNNVTVQTGNVAAGATPTLIRFGLYTEGLTQDLTLVASTPNDTSLLAATTTMYTKAFSASYDVVRGQRYAVGGLVVTAATVPRMCGSANLVGSGESVAFPRVVTNITGQTDLPSSVATSALLAGGNNFYARLG